MNHHRPKNSLQMNTGKPQTPLFIGELLVKKELITDDQLLQALAEQQETGKKLGSIVINRGWLEEKIFYQVLLENDAKSPVRHIGGMLVEKGFITQEQLKQALDEQKRTGQKIGDILRQWQWVDSEDFYKTLLESFRRRRIGELLVGKGFLKQEQLDLALDLQRRYGTLLGDIILAKGWVRTLDFHQTMAEHLGKPFIDLIDEPVDSSLWDSDAIDIYTEHLFIPWRKDGDKLILAICNPNPQSLRMIEQMYDEDTDFIITSKLDLHWTLQSHGRDYFKHMAVHKLAERQNSLSASQVFTTPQLLFIYLLTTAFLACFFTWPLPTLIAINMGLAVFLILNFGMRMGLAWVGSHESIDLKVTDEEVAALDDASLPTYTVLIPMYKEPEVLPIIAQSIRDLDYPLSKIDVKLILEEDDMETFEEAKKLGLEGMFEIIRVPQSLPQTKPKACNYALNFARGELVTIYDAEDKPEPDQLKKVVIAFRKSSKETAVIQARLNYFNGPENWLTKQFTIEYSLWFDFYLPALDALRIPIPLGGTSNHFRMNVLKEVDAWDPYNVTEDADLGVRLTQLNYRVGVVNSTTYEEANSQLHNWIRQRSRWLKGYMQTYLVHMRRPLHMYRLLGPVGFWGFQFFIGGTILSTLIAPLLYGMYFFWLITMTQALSQIFSPLALYISLFNLLIGNGFLIYLCMFSVFKRHYYSLIPTALTVPIYWLLMSWAAYKGLIQLINKPFYWEKTTHGLTTFKAQVITHKVDNA